MCEDGALCIFGVHGALRKKVFIAWPLLANFFNTLNLHVQDHVWTRTMLAALLRAGHAPVHVYEEDSEMARMKGPWWNNLVAEKHTPLRMQLADQIAEYNRSSAPAIAHSVVKNHNDCAAAIRADSVDLLVLANTRIIKPEVLEAARSGALNCHPDFVRPHAHATSKTFAALAPFF
jgi:hypothetical protein